MLVAAMSNNNEPRNESTKAALHSKRIAEQDTDNRTDSASVSAAGEKTNMPTNIIKTMGKVARCLLRDFILSFTCCSFRLSLSTMSLISKYTQPDVPKKEKMSREQLIGLLSSSSNMMDERDDIIAYINTLEAGKGLDEKAIKEGYKAFKDEKSAKEMASLADNHGFKDTEFQIFHGDSLLNDWDILNEMNPAKKLKCDAVVANPPFSYRWEPNDTLAEDFRFKGYGLAPKSAADFAFLLHELRQLAQAHSSDCRKNALEPVGVTHGLIEQLNLFLIILDYFTGKVKTAGQAEIPGIAGISGAGEPYLPRLRPCA